MDMSIAFCFTPALQRLSFLAFALEHFSESVMTSVLDAAVMRELKLIRDEYFDTRSCVKYLVNEIRILMRDDRVSQQTCPPESRELLVKLNASIDEQAFTGDGMIARCKFSAELAIELVRIYERAKKNCSQVPPSDSRCEAAAAAAAADNEQTHKIRAAILCDHLFRVATHAEKLKNMPWWLLQAKKNTAEGRIDAVKVRSCTESCSATTNPYAIPIGTATSRQAEREGSSVVFPVMWPPFRREVSYEALPDLFAAYCRNVNTLTDAVFASSYQDG